MKGFYFIVAGSILELLALLLHWKDWYHLTGEPDQLYTWIGPLFMVIIASGMIIAGTIRSFFTTRVPDFEVVDSTNIT